MSSLLLRTSALVLAAIGLPATFAPDAILTHLGAPVIPALLLVVQLGGALASAAAVLDWMLRDTLLGGIYGRPLVLANLLHFTSGALAAGKLVAAEPALRPLWPLVVVYAGLAVGFFVVLRRHPIRPAV